MFKGGKKMASFFFLPLMPAALLYHCRHRRNRRFASRRLMEYAFRKCVIDAVPVEDKLELLSSVMITRNTGFCYIPAAGPVQLSDTFNCNIVEANTRGKQIGNNYFRSDILVHSINPSCYFSESTHDILF